MDLIRLLRSLEEFLYELVGWLVFYPRTLFRILAHPGAIARYTRAELALPLDKRFEETISPVLMLILSVILVHGVELMTDIPLPKVASPIGLLLFGSEERLLLTRSAVFCVYAFGAAFSTLWREKQPITRGSLREPFSIQAFLVCPFIVLLCASEQLMRADAIYHTAGILVGAGAAIWYIVARATAYRALYPASWLKALALVTLWFSATTLLLVLALALLLA